MFETAGALAILSPAWALLALLVVPFAWTLLAALVRRLPLAAAIVSLAGASATLGLSIVAAVRLALLPHGHLLTQHCFQIARLGQLDLAFDLAIDPRGATFVVVIGLVACASTLHSTAGTGGRALPWTALATTGALLAVTGDGFAPIIVGLGLLSVGGWALAGASEYRPSVVTFGANVGVLVGLVFLFWALGGSFGAEGYDPDGAPRFVLVSTSTPSIQPGKATLVMTTHTGALVSADDADLPDEPIASPFSVAVDPGVYTLRVEGGAATGDVVIPRVAFIADRTHVLVPYGPTASLRAFDDQVAVPRPAPGGGVITTRTLLSGRAIGGLRASAVVLLFILCSALAHAHAFASRRGPAPIAGTLAAIPAIYFALRFLPIVEPGSADAALVILLGALSAVSLASRAAGVDDGHQALRGVLAAAISSSLVAVGLGEPSAAIVLATSAIVSTAAALGAVDARRDVRWLGVACAAAVGLFPGAGASAGYVLTLTTAIGSAATGTIGWAIFTGFVAVALVVAIAFGTLAAFRVYDVVLLASAREQRSSTSQSLVVTAMSAIALGGGAALGVGTTPFGGNIIPLARRLVGPLTVVAAPPREIAAVALVLSVGSGIAGLLLARRASASATVPRWLMVLGSPYAIVLWTGTFIEQLGAFLHRGVVVMDRDVVDDVPRAIGGVSMRLAGLLAPRGTRLNPALERMAIAALVKLDLDDPRKAERLRVILLLAMVALLGLVVLSSVFLG